MRIAPAEIVRTLASGHRPAHAHIAWNHRVFTVPTAPDRNGAPLLLVPERGRLDEALTGGDGEDAAVTLRYDDEPPLDDAPNWGSAWVCGWATPLRGTQSTDAAVDFATVAPLPELLDVGDGFGLWRVDVGETRLEQDGTVTEVSLEAFSSAEPDPWYGMEADLLHDLYDHHPDVLHALTHRMSHVVADISWVAPLRINRHGVVLDVHTVEGAVRRFFLRHRHDIERVWQLLDSMNGCQCAHDHI